MLLSFEKPLAICVSDFYYINLNVVHMFIPLLNDELIPFTAFISIFEPHEIITIIISVILFQLL